MPALLMFENHCGMYNMEAATVKKKAGTMRDITLPGCQREPRGRQAHGHETSVKTRIIEKVEYVTIRNDNNQGNRKKREKENQMETSQN